MRPAEYVSLLKSDPAARALAYTRATIARALSFAKFDQRGPEVIAADRWGAHIAETVTRTGVGAIATGSIHEDVTAFFGLVTDASIIGRIPGLRRWNFRVRTLDSGGVVGSEVDDGQATPIRIPSLSSFSLRERRFQAAIVATREALERGGEAAETGLRDDLLRSAADAIDAALVADLIAAADSSGFTGDYRYGVYLLHPSDAAMYADQRLDVRGGWFRGYPAVVTPALTPGTALFVDASRIAAAWSEGEIDFAQHATIEADTAPAMDSATPTGPSGALVSLFQTNSIAIRSTMAADWHIGAGAVEVVELAS